MRAGVFLGSVYGAGLPVFVILGSPVNKPTRVRPTTRVSRFSRYFPLGGPVPLGTRGS